MNADIARAGELIAGATPVPSQAASIGFVTGLGAICYGLSPKVMDKFNTVLVGGVVLTFLVSRAKLTPMNRATRCMITDEERGLCKF